MSRKPPRLTMLRPRLETLDPTRARIAPISTARIRGRACIERRWQVAVRDQFVCRACGRTTAPDDGHADHATPLHLGGPDTLDNLQWLCHDCHASKTSAEAGARAPGVM
jgi:5-methylcytosine-specific restriction enzyme A